MKLVHTCPSPLQLPWNYSEIQAKLRQYSLLLLRSCPSLQRCCWKMMLLSLHPNIVHVENVVSVFSSPSTSSQKVQKCGGHKFLSQAIECGQLVSSSLLDRILVNCFSELSKFAALHPNIIVHVENVVSLFSSPSTSSQKVRKCGSNKFLSQAIECGQLVSSSLLDRIQLVNYYHYQMALYTSIDTHTHIHNG